MTRHEAIKAIAAVHQGRSIEIAERTYIVYSLHMTGQAYDETTVYVSGEQLGSKGRLYRAETLEDAVRQATGCPLVNQAADGDDVCDLALATRMVQENAERYASE